MIINNACLISLWPNEPAIEGALVAVEGKSIVDFGKVGKLVDRYDQPEVLDVSGRLVLPGLIDAHAILGRSLWQGAPADVAPERAEAALDPESLYWSAMAGLLDAVRSGVTSLFVAIAGGSEVGARLEALRRAFSEVGVRGALAPVLSSGREAASGLAEASRQLADVRASGGQGMRGLVGLRLGRGIDDDAIRSALDLSQEQEARFHFILEEGAAPFAKRLEGLGALQRGGLVACRSPLAGEDDLVLRDHDVWAVHLARSAVIHGFETSDLRRGASARVKIALGTDGEGGAGGIAEEFRFAALRERARGRRLADGIAVAFRAAFHGNPDLATATFGRDAGRIKPGATADLVVLDHRPSIPMEATNVAEGLFWSAPASPVHTVVVNGRPLYQNHKFVALDEERIRARAREAAREIWERQ